MPSKVAELFVEIRAQQDKLASDMASTKTAVEKHAGGIGKSFATALSSAIGGFIGAALGGSAGGFMDKIFGFNRSQEMMSRQLQITGGAAGFSADQFNQMAEAMESTFSKMEKMNALNALNNNSIKGDNLVKAFQVAGDVAAFEGRRIEDVAKEIGQAFSSGNTGKLMELLDRTKIGPDITPAMRENWERRLQMGGAATPGVQREILDLLRSQYRGMAAGAGGTVSGSWDKIWSSISDVVNRFAVQTGPLFVSVFNNISEWIDSNGPALNKWAGEFVDAMSSIYMMLEKEGKNIWNAARQIVGAVQEVINGFIKGSDKMERIMATLTIANPFEWDPAVLRKAQEKLNQGQPPKLDMLGQMEKAKAEMEKNRQDRQERRAQNADKLDKFIGQSNDDGRYKTRQGFEYMGFQDLYKNVQRQFSGTSIEQLTKKQVDLAVQANGFQKQIADNTGKVAKAAENPQPARMGP